MGRHSSRPEASPIPGTTSWVHITRVVDPDDEFAETQWLSRVWQPEVEGDHYTWSPNLGDRTVEVRPEVASMLLRMYQLGYEDAAERCTIPPLGS